jgi:hypothetical protein
MGSEERRQSNNADEMTINPNSTSAVRTIIFKTGRLESDISVRLGKTLKNTNDQSST